MANRNGGHPLLRGRDKGVWYADAVGVVPGYPRSPEVHAARMVQLKTNFKAAKGRGKLANTRLGVPNGWAGRKGELAEMRSDATELAEAAVNKLFEPDCYEARLCMEHALAIALNPSVHVQHRITAMRIVLEYAQVRPAARQVLQGQSGLEFLRRLAYAIDPTS